VDNSSKSFLVIGQDIEALKKHAAGIIPAFNKADVFWLGNDGTIQVKETVQFMEKAHLCPVGDGKLMIVCDFSCVTPQAQNKMLKTIEEAPARTTFLLLATNIEPVLSTIQSRCITIFLPRQDYNIPLLDSDITLTLSKTFGVKFDEKALNQKARHDILNALSEVNKRTAANCNEVNQKDLLIMEILKHNAKNSKH